MDNFYIEEKKFSYDLRLIRSSTKKLKIKASPDSYNVSISNATPYKMIKEMLKKVDNPVLLIDSKIYRLYFKNVNLQNTKIYKIVANEDNKNIDVSIKFTEFLSLKKITKSSTIIVVGGGIIQDIAAFSCAIYKRGIDWIYFPTTFLAMTDSCIGAKTALNYKKIKNFHALFSAPKSIIINTKFLDTLSLDEIASGLGESLKLSIIGGPKALTFFEKHIDKALDGDVQSRTKIILMSLLVKKAVIEKDEFEKYHRRSLNYGHSFGHAIEPIAKYKIPHGVAVVLGILVENIISTKKYGLSQLSQERIRHCAKKLINNKYINILKTLNLERINNYLINDKKTLGTVLKLAIPTRIGKIEFCDFKLNNNSKILIKSSVELIVTEFRK